MLNPAACRQAIRLHGEGVRWLEALPCDCLDPGDPEYGDHRGCEKCQYGYVYREQVLRRDEKALVTEVRREYLHPDLGLLLKGDLLCVTMADELPFGNWDRLVLTGRELHKKERVKYETDSLAEEYPAKLLSVASSDAEFVAGADYTFDAVDGKVVWTDGGSHPDAGATYAVHYLYNPVFWYTASGLKTPRPITGRTALMPQSGRLSLKHPVEG